MQRSLLFFYKPPCNDLLTCGINLLWGENIDDQLVRFSKAQL